MLATVQVPRDKMITLTIDLNRVRSSFYLAVTVSVSTAAFLCPDHRLEESADGETLEVITQPSLLKPLSLTRDPQ